MKTQIKLDSVESEFPELVGKTVESVKLPSDDILFVFFTDETYICIGLAGDREYPEFNTAFEAEDFYLKQVGLLSEEDMIARQNAQRVKQREQTEAYERNLLKELKKKYES